MLKYPIPKEKRIAIVKVYYHVCTTPGMPNHVVATCSDGLQALCRSKKKLSVEDLRLPWKPIYKILSKDLFLTRRQFEIRQVLRVLAMLCYSLTALRCMTAKHPGTWDILLRTFADSFILRQLTRCYPPFCPL